MKRTVFVLKDVISGGYFEEGYGSMPHTSSFEKAALLLSLDDVNEKIKEIKEFIDFEIKISPFYLSNSEYLHPKTIEMYQNKLDRASKRKELSNYGILIESYELNNRPVTVPQVLTRRKQKESNI